MITSKLFQTEDGKNRFVTFLLISSLFLLWGFLNGMIDVMDKHFQEELNLSLSQSAWVQFAHYLGYFLMALPAGHLASRLGYKGGIIVGLLMVAAGGFWFIAATHIATFWAFLLGVCVIASGLTFLETVANPYTTVLGPRESSATRINLAQSCNGIGWIFGPIAGAMFFYSTDADGKSTGAETLWIPYAAVGVFVLLLSLVFWKADLPEITPSDDADAGSGLQEQKRPASPVATGLFWINVGVLSASVGMIFTALAALFDPDERHALGFFLISSVGAFVFFSQAMKVRFAKALEGGIWTHSHFSFATIAQFFYVAAQSGIFAYFINYMTSQAPVAISNQTASTLASAGFALFLAGRFTGAFAFRKFAPHKVLGLYGACNAVLCALVMLKLGWVSVVCVFLSYFFMSIMFPTLFALGIHGLGSASKAASAYIVMAIMGGAIVPKVMGALADSTSVSIGFLVPLICFGVVSAYGFLWPKLSENTTGATVSLGKGH